MRNFLQSARPTEHEHTEPTARNVFILNFSHVRIDYPGKKLRQNVVLKHVTDKYIGKHMNWKNTTKNAVYRCIYIVFFLFCSAILSNEQVLSSVQRSTAIMKSVEKIKKIETNRKESSECIMGREMNETKIK